VHTELWTYLQSQISGTVGTRLYPLHLPQQPTYPAATYQVVTAMSVANIADLSDLKEWRLQVDAWAESYSECNALAVSIRNALDGYQGAAGTAQIQVSLLANWMETYEDGLSVYRVSQDFELTYTEA